MNVQIIGSEDGPRSPGGSGPPTDPRPPLVWMTCTSPDAICLVLFTLIPSTSSEPSAASPDSIKWTMAAKPI